MRARAGPLFTPHSVRLPGRSVCVSVCRPVLVTPTNPDRDEQVACSRRPDARWSTDRGHGAKQIITIKRGPGAWNVVKRRREQKRERFNGFRVCVQHVMHMSNVTQISSPAKPRSSRERAVSQRENEPRDVRKTAYSNTTLMRRQRGASAGRY